MELSTSGSHAGVPLAEEVARLFCADARAGRVPAGVHVQLRDLMSSYDASRSAAREAMALLRRKRLLTPDVGGRLLLRLPTPTEVREIFALRTTLAMLVLEIGMERLSDAELERMHASVNRLRAAVVDARWDIDRPVTAAFNNVARITGSPMPLRMMADLHEQSRSYRALLEDRMARPTPIREGEHLDDMWRAVAARDVATVRRLHRVHLEKVAEWVVGQLPESA